MARSLLKLEVGVVYRAGNGKLWLAVAPDTLLTFRRGSRRPELKRPRRGFAATKQITVDELLERWGIPVDVLDQMTRELLPPAKLPSKLVNERGRTFNLPRRRSRDVEAEAWKRARTVRGMRSLDER